MIRALSPTTSIALICAMLVALSAADSAEAQDKTAALQVAGKRWDACALRSFAIQRQRIPDLNLAAETALAACTTEEQIFSAVIADLPPVQLAQSMAMVRAKMKARIMAVR